MKRKRLIIAAIIIAAILLSGTGFYIFKTFASIPEMFRLNKELQEEGYYMAEFEFKMLGCVYYLDKGQYLTAFTKLNELHKQLKTRVGLIKAPKFADQKEELEFYLSLQNPRTGAFMDNSYPLCTYPEPTLNVLEHLDNLAHKTGQPLRLRYSLKFLDEVNTPEKLKAYLDDLATVGWIGAKLPKTPYILASTLKSYRERNDLYSFSPEWKQALLQWFYENQDIKTGFWGPRLRNSGELLNSGDLVDTFHIIKLFVDDKGNDIYPEFPLRYKNEMFRTVLQKFADQMPNNDRLDELHDWTLSRDQGIKVLTRYLWNGASQENKNSAMKLIEDIVRIRFEKYYIPQEGAFSFYPGADYATLDGTAGLGLFKQIGAISNEEQKYLWGLPEENIIDLGIHEVSKLAKKDFILIENSPKVNSLRLYRHEPDYNNFTANVFGIVYPKETPVLDVMELVPKVKQWLNTTSQSMGNWVSKEAMIQELADINIQPVAVSKGDIPLQAVNEVLQQWGEMTVIGFDALQIPRYKMIFRFK